MAVSYVPGVDGAFFLYCSTTGFPPPVVTWLDPTGTTITTALLSDSSTSQGIFPVGTLYVEVETNFEQLEFTCVATIVYNDMNWTASDSVFLNTGKLTVYSRFKNSIQISHAEPPSVVSEDGPVKMVTDGLGVAVQCRVTGYPTPSIQWFYNGVEIVPDTTVTITLITNGDNISSRLIIETVSYPEHQGTYVCMAENSEGIDFATVLLDIQCEYIQNCCCTCSTCTDSQAYRLSGTI